MANFPDKLGALLGEIESWCAEYKVKLIYGEVNTPGQLPEITFAGAGEPSLSEFLQTLSQVPLSVLIVNVIRLSREEWQERIDAVEDAETAEEKARLRELKGCENLVGCVREIALAAFVEKPPLVLTFNHYAEWDAMFEDDANNRFVTDEEKWEDPRTSPRFEELARRVANDQRFAAAKKQAERQYVAKIVLRDEDMDARDLYHVTQQAASIFELEIKPALEEKLAKQVESLHRAGQSVSEIAKSLKLAPREVKRLLD